MEITSWKLIDSGWLKAALHEFLLANLARGSDLLPTPKNVSSLLSIGFEGAKAGDPCLVGIVGGEPVAFVLWAGVGSALDCRWKTVYAYGSYTLAGARSKGVAGALRAEARALSKALGYERVIGPVALSNERGVREFIEQGAWPTHAQFEVLL